jgi:hypothetical protein
VPFRPSVWHWVPKAQLPALSLETPPSLPFLVAQTRVGRVPGTIREHQPPSYAFLLFQTKGRSRKTQVRYSNRAALPELSPWLLVPLSHHPPHNDFHSPRLCMVCLYRLSLMHPHLTACKPTPSLVGGQGSDGSRTWGAWRFSPWGEQSFS